MPDDPALANLPPQIREGYLAKLDVIASLADLVESMANAYPPRIRAAQEGGRLSREVFEERMEHVADALNLQDSLLVLRPGELARLGVGGLRLQETISQGDCLFHAYGLGTGLISKDSNSK